MAPQSRGGRQEHLPPIAQQVPIDEQMLATATLTIELRAAPRFCAHCTVCKSPSLHFEDYFVEKIHEQVIAGRSAVVHRSPHAFPGLVIGALEQLIILGLPLAAVLDNIVASRLLAKEHLPPCLSCPAGPRSGSSLTVAIRTAGACWARRQCGLAQPVGPHSHRGKSTASRALCCLPAAPPTACTRVCPPTTKTRHDTRTRHDIRNSICLRTRHSQPCYAIHSILGAKHAPAKTQTIFKALPTGPSQTLPTRRINHFVHVRSSQRKTPKRPLSKIVARTSR